MKSRNLAAVLAASALAAVACSRVKPVTTVCGEALDGLENVYFTCPATGLDTMVVAENGSFELEIPSDVLAMVNAECGSNVLQFVADGTKITIDFENSKAVSSRKHSIQSRYNDLVKTFIDFNKEYQEGAEAVYYDETLSQEVKDSTLETFSKSKISEIKDILSAAVRKNSDNVVGVSAFMQAAMLADNDLEVMSYMELLGPKARSLEDVAGIENSIKVREGLGEGSMFVDFSVNSVVGFDEDGKEIVKPVCFSDYVGQGKYVLVDFWASWCAPCKAEIPNIMDVYDNFAGDRFDVLSVAVWDEPANTFAAAQEEGICWNQIVCTTEDRSIPTEKYGIEGIPQIFLFAPDGTIVARGLRGEAIAAKVSEVLGL